MAKRTPRGNECPFTIVVDKNEYLPQHLGYRFESIDPRPKVVTANLFLGDYTLLGPAGGLPGSPPGGGVVVERKTLADLYQSFGGGGKRENMIDRVRLMAETFAVAYVVVEAEYSEVVGNPPRFTKVRPRSLSGTIIACQQRYRGCHWAFMPGRDAAERMTYRILERYYEDHADIQEIQKCTR